TLDDPDKAAEVVADAMHTAVTGRPGPVVVGLPEEILVKASSGTVLPPRTHGSAAPYAGDVTELRARILQADRPVLIIGGEDWSPVTSRRIAQWSRDRGLGVIGTFRAYDGVDHDSPNFLGILGFGASEVAKRTFAEADLHIFLGCVRTDVATNGFTIGTDAKTVVIGPDADAHGHFGSLDQHIVTPVNRFAQALFTEDGARAYSVSSDGSIDEPATGDEHLADNDEPVPLPEWIRDARSELEEWRVPVTGGATSANSGSGAGSGSGDDGDGFVDMDEAFVHVKELLPDNAIITYGAGNFSGWATRFLPTHGFPSALGPRNGSMGFGLPAAVAAGLVHPERPVFCIAGDGDFLMNGQELATAAQYGVNLTVVVNDNSVYGTILGHQDREYPGRATGTALRSPDFAAMATAFGGLGLSVERTEDFRDAFEQALAHEGPALVRCLTDPAIRGARV
ncbi:MAG: thiamine pyrophosphate-dependent enzyme, partial [Brevibacterium aurantiacum]